MKLAIVMAVIFRASWLVKRLGITHRRVPNPLSPYTSSPSPLVNF